ncbi:MAG: PEP-CTERM sorting domain-containing protein [Planctomycetes bacterium]|nr:PEP-CTERM sorting domain-containing protein [Planctomycetota bacterium]
MIIKKCAYGLTVAMALCVTGTAQAYTIILDTFTDTDGTQLEGRAPDTTNLPNGAWARTNLFWGASIQGNAFQAGPDNGWTVELASFGPYTRPDALTISADLNVLTLTDGGGGGGGWGLGFNQTLGAGPSPYGTFTGLVLHQDGRLTYREEGSDIISVPWSGPTFDPDAYYHLSYDVNTSTGALSNISLEDSTADYSPLEAAGAFTLARTTYAAMYANGGNAGNVGFIDNFLVEGADAPAVPEPSTLVLLTLGGIGLIGYAARKRYRA